MKYEAVERMVVFMRDRVSTHVYIDGKEPEQFFLCADNWDAVYSWRGWPSYSRRLGKWAPKLFGAEHREPVRITVEMSFHMKQIRDWNNARCAG